MRQGHTTGARRLVVQNIMIPGRSTILHARTGHKHNRTSKGLRSLAFLSKPCLIKSARLSQSGAVVIEGCSENDLGD
jgi:hypothetical protein